MTNATVAANATRIGVTQAALQFGGGVIPEFSAVALILVFASVAGLAVLANKKQRYIRVVR
jgi:hypothetical protein